MILGLGGCDVFRWVVLMANVMEETGCFPRPLDGLRALQQSRPQFGGRFGNRRSQRRFALEEGIGAGRSAPHKH